MTPYESKQIEKETRVNNKLEEVIEMYILTDAEVLMLARLVGGLSDNEFKSGVNDAFECGLDLEDPNACSEKLYRTLKNAAEDRGINIYTGEITTTNTKKVL